TKLKANASIHQNITRENAWKRKKEIEQWIHQKLQEADRQDQEEDDRLDDQNLISFLYEDCKTYKGKRTYSFWRIISGSIINSATL
ncbi:hypothetical protein LLG10_03600, partial [bacterium]|nr:hypothetical protein [bacterium]